MFIFEARNITAFGSRADILLLSNNICNIIDNLTIYQPIRRQHECRTLMILRCRLIRWLHRRRKPEKDGQFRKNNIWSCFHWRLDLRPHQGKKIWICQKILFTFIHLMFWIKSRVWVGFASGGLQALQVMVQEFWSSRGRRRKGAKRGGVYLIHHGVKPALSTPGEEIHLFVGIFLCQHRNKVMHEMSAYFISQFNASQPDDWSITVWSCHCLF